jgi:TPP-dependent pyruvate/acetoin dehydrogenase alpha subunit
MSADVTASELEEIEATVQAWIDQGVAEAEASPQPDPSTILEGVYAR